MYITTFFSFFEHRLHKILIRRAFYSPGERISFFSILFSGTYISRIFWLQRSDSPVVKIFFRIQSCDVSKDEYWNTELIYRINFAKCPKMFDWHAKNRAFGKFSEFNSCFTTCVRAVQSIFNIFEKLFDICVQCLNARLLNRHKVILKKIFFKLF